MSEKPTASQAGAGEREPLPSADAEACTSELERLRHEAQEHKERWLRAQADYQNLRRRQQTDIDNALRRALESLLQNLLVVVDHLELALAADARSEDAGVLAQGVRQTREQLLGVLRQEGVQPIAHSRAFDANLHQAVATVVSSEHAPGEIVDFLREGYTLRGLVLRAAHVRVAVAAGQPKDGGTPLAPGVPMGAPDAG